MNPYDPPRDLAAAYRMGELQAQLTAERENVQRVERANALLLDLLSKQQRPTKQVSPDADLAQQRLQASEQRIRELELELELRLKELQLEQSLRNSRHEAREAQTGQSGTVRRGSVQASPVEMESTARLEKEGDVMADGVQTCDVKSSRIISETSAEAKKDSHEKFPDSGVQEAEWMLPVKAKAGAKPESVRTKPVMKRYFTPAAPAVVKENAVVETESTTVKKESESSSQSKANEDKIQAPQPVHPPVAMRKLSTPHPNNEPERYGRFERDHPRAPRSHGRPPPNPRPYYAPPYPQQYWPQFPPPPHPYFHPRAPPVNPRLTSYCDVDMPTVPQFGEQVISSSVHDLPSTGYVDFNEDLYDEQPSSTDEKKTSTNRPVPKGQPPNAPIIPHRIPAGLKKSIHANQHWPVFTSIEHNRRHVDLTNIPDATPLATVLKQVVTPSTILSVTPPHRKVRVLTPMETHVSLTTTLEFARGDAASAFVASTTTTTAPIEISGTPVKAVQRADPSAPIERALGEQVWRRGATRRVVIEGAGAALRVPANLRYQIESCPYRRGGGSGRLVGPPEFLADGAIRVVFLDVRDAVVAVRTWSGSPIFRDVGVGFEGKGVVPELEEESTGEEERAAPERDASPAAGEKVEVKEQAADAESGGADGQGFDHALKIDNAGPDPELELELELEKEKDPGYAAGSSEDLEASSAPPASPNKDGRESQGEKLGSLIDQSRWAS